MASGHRAPLIVSPVGSGKCLGKGTSVLMYDGHIKKVEDIVIGDVLMGPDSCPRNVLSINSGVGKLYKIIPTKGKEWICNEDHILCVKRYKYLENKITHYYENIELKKYFELPKSARFECKQYKTGVNFKSKNIEFDPYVCGFWLGDGGKKGNQIYIGDSKLVCVNYFKEWADKNALNFRMSDKYRGCYNLYFTNKINGKNKNKLTKIKNKFTNDNNERFIPHEYKTASLEDRWKLFAGLMDSDGSYLRNTFDFTTKYKSLADDLEFLAESLGCRVKKTLQKKSIKSIGFVGEYWRLSIVNDFFKFKKYFLRHIPSKREINKDHLCTGFKVEPIGLGEYFGFEIDGDRRFLLHDFTVTHNTVMFSYFTSEIIKKGKTVIIVAHREELLNQISETLTKFNVPHGFIAANRIYDNKYQVHVASVFTLVRRMYGVRRPDVIITDEAHHCSKESSWGRVFSFFDKAWRIGVTATPCRLSGEPLSDVFDDMILGPSMQQLISIGALSKYKIFAPPGVSLSGLHTRMGDFITSELVQVVDKPSITGSAINEYIKHAHGKRAIVFCCSVEHAKNVAEQFKKHNFSAGCIDGSMESDDRKKLVADFTAGKTQIMTSISVVSEGFDLPAIECAIMLRPTQSLSMWIQTSGRALRPHTNKEYAIILDHAGNCERHGMPDEEREWTLDGAEKNRGDGKSKGPSVRICPKCFGAGYSVNTVCAYCGHVFEVESRELNEVDGELVEVDAAMIAKKKRVMQGRAQTLQELEELGRQRGYKRPRLWAHAVWRGRLAKRGQR